MSALIVDDEAPAIEIVRLFLEQYPFVGVIGACSDGRSAINFIQQEKPDLVFLDIQMPEVSGFDVIRAIPDAEMPYIVFTTAYDHYAIQAFEINAIDYLLKPIAADRFHSAVLRAREAYENRAARHWNQKMKALLQVAPADGPSGFLKKLSVKVGSRIKFIPIEDVIWIGAENQYVRIYTINESYLLRQSLNKLEVSLSPGDFYRCHRSAIIQVHAIHQIEPYFKGDYLIYLKDGSKTKLSRNRVEGLRRILPW